MQLLVLNGDDVRALLPMGECIGLMRGALALAPASGTVQPIRTGIPAPGGRGGMGLMPGAIDDPARLGIKIVTVFPGNHGGPLGSHQGMVLLFDAANGAPLAVIEARALTAIRTAAASAAATDVLARGETDVLAVLGCGDQGAAHLDALPRVRRFERLLVWGRDPDKTVAFAATQSKRLGRRIEAVGSVKEAARLADILCAVTSAAEPILEGAWLRPGHHLNLVGSSVPTTAEIDSQAVARGRWFVDYEPSARALSGEFRRAVAAGVIGEDHLLGAVGEVIAGTIPGRISEADITIFKSLGMAAEDLVTADFLLSAAEARGVGQRIEW